MRPKMRKNWIHRKLKVLGISPGSGSVCARGQELEGIFGGAGSGRMGVGFWNEDDQSQRRTFLIFFLTLFFGYQ